MAYESYERYYKKLKGARLVYKEHMTQTAVAKILGVSRPTLAKMLDEAVSEGIVRFEVVDIRNESNLLNMEIELKEKYGLRDTVIVNCADDDPGVLLQNLGKASAEYFESILHRGMRIGVSWGKTMESFSANLIKTRKVSGLEVVSLIGGSLYLDSRYHSSTIVQRVVDKYSGSGYFLYAPTYADNEEQLAMYMSSPQIQDVLALARKVDVALVGIGAPLHDYTELYRQLKMESAQIYTCGLNAQHLNSEGVMLQDLPDDDPLYPPEIMKILRNANKLVIGLHLQELKKIERVIGVAGGKAKHEAIRSVLLGGYINILITDKNTAQYLIESI